MNFSPLKALVVCLIAVCSTARLQGQTIHQIIDQVVHSSSLKMESALDVFALVDSRWRTEPAQAIKLCDSIITVGETAENVPLTILGNLLYATEVNEIDVVKQHLTRASFLVKENLRDTSSQILHAYIEFLWGNYFQYKKTYASLALQHLYKAELILEKYASPLLQKLVKMELVYVNYNYGQYDVTIRECTELIENKKKYQLLDGELMLIYNALGLSYSDLRQFDKSRFYFNTAFRYNTGNEKYRKFWNTLLKSNMAAEYFYKKEYADYISLFQQDALNCKEMNDYDGLINTYISLAKAYLITKRVRESALYLDSIQSLAKEKNIVIHSHANLSWHSISIQIDLYNKNYASIGDKVNSLILMNDTATAALARQMSQTAQLLAKAGIMQDEYDQKNLLLQQLEFKRKEQRNLTVFIVMILIIVFSLIYFWISRRNLHKTLRLNIELNQAQALKSTIESELAMTRIELTKLTEEIELKKKQLVSQSVTLVQKNETINEIKSAIQKMKRFQADNDSIKEIISGMMSQVNRNNHLENEWELFRLQFEETAPGFITKLKTKYPELSETDLRFCALFKINLNSAQIASLLNITAESVKAARHRLRKKMKLMPNQNIHQFLEEDFNG